MARMVFLSLFAAASGAHLAFSWRDDAKGRACTKPFPLLFLILYYLSAAGERLSVALLLALLTSWLGDLLLIPKGHRWFAMGGVSFGLAHLLFIAVYLPQIDPANIPWGVLLPLAAAYYGVSLGIIRALRPTTPRSMIVPMYVYLLANSTMNLFAISQALALGGPGAKMACLGALLFFISDCALFLTRYYKNPDVIFKRHFTVMLTYLLGELLITQGMLTLL